LGEEFEIKVNEYIQRGCRDESEGNHFGAPLEPGNVDIMQSRCQ